MTEEQQNILVATKIMGWCDVESRFGKGPHSGTVVGRVVDGIVCCKWFTRSLDSCALMGRRLAEMGKQEEYAMLISGALGTTCHPLDLPFVLFSIATASPQVRVSAALRAVGAWEE